MFKTNFVRHWPVLLLLLVQLLAGIIISPMRSFFPIYATERLAYAAAAASAIVAAGQFVGMVTSLIGGTVSDSIGHKWALALGLAASAVGSALYFSRAPWLVTVLWIVGVIGLTFISLGGQSYLNATVSKANLGALSALYNWGFTLGGALSSPGAGWLLDQYGFGALGWALVGLSLAGAVTAGLLPRQKHAATETKISPFRALTSYGGIVRRPVILTLGMLRFLPTCYYGMAMVLLPLLVKAHAGSNTAVALFTTIMLIVASFAQIVAGRAADRLGRRAPTLITYSIVIVATVGATFFSDVLWGIYVFGILGVSAAWALSTLMPTLVADAAPVEEHGRIFGFLHLLWNGGMIVGALIGGALMEIAVGLPFAVTTLSNVVALVLAVLFFRLTARYGLNAH
ncbi:MAG: MFS transporter [Anaerolineae bacterium]